MINFKISFFLFLCVCKEELNNDLIAKSEGATDFEKQVDVVPQEKIEPSLQKVSQFKDDSENIKKQKNDLFLLKQSNDFHFYSEF